MRKIFAIAVALVCLCASSVALAGECRVTSSSGGSGEGTLRRAVASAAGGGCLASDSLFADGYREFYPSATRFHAVRITGSMDIYLEEPLVIGGASDGNPVVITADKGAVVKLRGDGEGRGDGVVVEGDRVIIDHITVQSFPGVGIQIRGDDNLIIHARAVSNSEDGIVVVGRDNRIVDSESANNGFNGIVIGRGSTATGCGAGSQNSTAGSGTALRAVSARENGDNVIGSSCLESTDAAPGACAMIKLEAQRCWAVAGEEPPCEDPHGSGDDEACTRWWSERKRCEAVLARAGVAEGDDENSAVDRMQGVMVGANGGFGVMVDAPDVAFDGWQPPASQYVLYGLSEIMSEARYSGSIRKNRSYGVYVNALTDAWLCRDVAGDDGIDDIVTASISETTFEKNAVSVGATNDNGVYISGPPPPRIAHVAAVGDSRTTEYIVKGSAFARVDVTNPWTRALVNPDAIRVEVYLAAEGTNEGAYYLAAQDGVESGTGDFAVRIPNPLLIDGIPVQSPSFVVTYIDTEHGATAPFSYATGTTSEDDSDGDGVPDVQEDIDGDGIVGPGESDPANPDTDSDGLTDGEERLQMGRIAELIEEGIVFESIGKLDPANPDSDGDCLPDGMEVGFSREEAEAMIERMSVRPQYTLTPACRAILSKASVLKLTNAISYDTDALDSLYNIAIIYDSDPDTVTDPTSSDTDRDGLMDGEEDRNFSGGRDRTGGESLSKDYDYSQPAGGEVIDTCAGDAMGWTETDPTETDSDGDELIDGEEGSVAKIAAERGKNESSPILCDTDDDGVPDGMEKRVGTFVNACDSDEDGLADGIELGIIHPTAAKSECRGLQAAGTNMRHPNALDPGNPDSDGDGIEDGIEDMNRNGWVDGSESDPSIADTDGDGTEDGIEFTGDFDADGVPDFDMRLISNGRNCNPPSEIYDLDCDGIVNSRDEDSDNDGCPDSLEGGWLDNNGNGIPDMYDADALGCNAGSGGSNGGGSIPSVGATPEDEGESNWHVPEWALNNTGGSACTLAPHSSRGSSRGTASFMFVMILGLGILWVYRRSRASRRLS